MVQKRILASITVVFLVGMVASSARDSQDSASRPSLPPEGLDAASWAKISNTVREAEYRVTSQESAYPDNLSAAYQAPNRVHNLRTYFTESGIRVRPLTRSEPSWEWGLSLVGYGYEDAIRPVPAAELTVQGNRVEYRRGNLIEWYVNDEGGLEQGFTLQEPPGERQRGSLVLELRPSGSLSPRQEIAGLSIVLADVGGEALLRYSGLAAWDATGQVLPAHMSASADSIVIRVQEDGAVYPVTIDPTVSQVKKLTASDAGVQLRFGFSVAISGDTVVVGAYFGDNGSAYVFERNQGGLNNWGEVKKLTASDAVAGDPLDIAFGRSVAISGDTVVVGARGNHDAGTLSGSAYVFERNQGGLNNWGERKKLTASDAAAGDQFGHSVAISGDTILVGAWHDDAPCPFPLCTNSGSAYVFQRNQGGPSNWGEVKKLIASDGGSHSNFGFSVAGSGDTAVVGGRAAYVFERHLGGLNNWGELKNLRQFGRFSVAISGDTLVLGDENDGTCPSVACESGSAYVYQRSQGGPNNWGEVKKLTASDAGAGDFFGISVAISGDTAVVGAWQDDDACPSDPSCGSGSAYVFERNQGGPNNWGEFQKLTASDAAAGDLFGFSVATTGDTILVGAWQDDDDGSAYVFTAPCLLPDTDLFLEDWLIDTTEVFEACNSITAGPNFRIAAPGGDVTFRTRNSVILVNGFSVESGARLTIQLDP